MNKTAVMLSGACLVAGCLLGSVCSAQTGAQADVIANGSNGPIAIPAGSSLALSISLVPGSYAGRAADWWLVRSDSSGLQSFIPGVGSWTWTSGLAPGYQGAAIALPATEVYSTSSLPVGEYTYYFGIDGTANGSVDFASLVYDSVSVSVYNSSASVSDGSPYVDVYDPSKACKGTFLLYDGHDSSNPKVIEVDNLGRIIWEYTIPTSMRGSGQFVGVDAELLSNGNVLLALSGSGIYEVDRNGTVVWSYADPKVSHDADRLSSGNTLYVYGNNDTVNDAQVKEVNSSGQLVWSWYAKNTSLYEQFKNLFDQGWTHTNAVTRLSNGNTLVSPRNFGMAVEVDTSGAVVWSYDWSKLGGDPADVDPHEPEIQSDDNLLVCLQNSSPYAAAEIVRSTGTLVWSYPATGLRTTRDCNRLPNGNTLLLSVMTQGTTTLNDDESVIFQVTPAGETVWRMRLKNAPVGQAPGHFYKVHPSCS